MAAVLQYWMGRTVPSFRIVLAMEKAEQKPLRNALDKKDRKQFDEMFDTLEFTFPPALILTASATTSYYHVDFVSSLQRAKRMHQVH